MMPALQLPLVRLDSWVDVRDGNDLGRSIFDRHYSRRRYADGRTPKLEVGPGEKMVLIHETGRALFVWRKFIDDSGQQGVNCAVFRNEGAGLSSELIREADARAEARWPGERHYTYVRPDSIRSTNPGYCFIAAGWRHVGWTKGGLRILAREAFGEVPIKEDRPVRLAREKAVEPAHSSQIRGPRSRALSPPPSHGTLPGDET